MLSLLLLVVTICLSGIIIRIGTIALELTGLPQDKAEFQSLSSFAGVGFTTKEAELVVNNPQRRKIIRILITLGSAGVVTSIATLAGALVSTPAIMDSFMHDNRLSWLPVNPPQLVLIVFTVFLVLILSALRQPSIQRLIKEVVSVWLIKEHHLQPTKLEEVIDNGSDYGVFKITICEKNPLNGQTIAEARLKENDISVLSIESLEQTTTYPDQNRRITTGDNLILFGPSVLVKKLCSADPEQSSPSSKSNDADSPLALNIEAPDFSLKDQDGNTFTLSEYRNKSVVVLVFYPKNKSYFCSAVIKSFSEATPQLDSLNIKAVAINPSSEASHKDFCELIQSDMPVLSDPQKTVCRAYKALMLGGLIVNRTVYIIDRQGIIRYAKRGKPPLSEIVSVARQI